MMFQISDNSQLCIDSQYSSQQLTIVWSLVHHSTQPILIFFRVRVLHLDRLKELVWGHRYQQCCPENHVIAYLADLLFSRSICTCICTYTLDNFFSVHLFKFVLFCAFFIRQIMIMNLHTKTTFPEKGYIIWLHIFSFQKDDVTIRFMLSQSSGYIWFVKNFKNMNNLIGSLDCNMVFQLHIHWKTQLIFFQSVQISTSFWLDNFYLTAVFF